MSTLKLKRKSESEIILSQLMLPKHANFNGKVHGGYVLEIMDRIAFACAARHAENYFETASVNTVNFLQPLEVGELLTLKASINYVDNSSMVVGIRVESQKTNPKNQSNIAILLTLPWWQWTLMAIRYKFQDFR